MKTLLCPLPAMAFSLLLLCSVQAQNPTTSTYQYLSIYENTIFNEMQSFWFLDTLQGKIHSNDTIRFQGGGYPGGPVFLDTISTSAPIFMYVGTASPVFTYEPIMNAPRVALPQVAQSARDLAMAQGNFFTDGGMGQYKFRLVFSPIGWKLYRAEMGVAFIESDSAVFAYGALPEMEVIFVDGYLELRGLVRGTVTVGAHGCNNPNAMGYHCIRLIDDLRYLSSNGTTGEFDSTSTDMLLIISESDIVIGNTPANGKDNGGNLFPGDPDHSDIIITGALVALGEMLTFEDQNDSYVWEYSSGYVGPTPDERGNIWLRGSLAQYRRGYVHRSNHGSTGYSKRFYYDARLDTMWLPGIKARHIPVFQPTQLEFGEVQINQADTLDLVLQNDGGTYFDLQGVQTGLPTFTVMPVDSTTLSPSEEFMFRVIFQPAEDLPYADTLVVGLYYGSDLKVPLSGTGSALGVAPVSSPDRFCVQLSPNPFNGELHISFNQTLARTDLAIRDIHGRIVASDKFENGSYQWRPTGLAGGIYFITLSTQQGSICRKVVYLK